MVLILKEQVAGGQYTVDARAVAEAMIEKRASLRELWSQMLVAAQPDSGPARKPEPLPADDGA